MTSFVSFSEIHGRNLIGTGSWSVYTTMNAFSPAPSSRTWHHTVRLGVAVTIAAATVAWLLASVAHLSEQAVLLTAVVAAFFASWTASAHRQRPSHRVTLVPARVRSR